MNLARFRERLFTFFLPVLIVGIVLGYVLWLFGTKYFWDTASLTVQIPADSETVATLSVQAEILHYDIPIPAFLHFAIELLMSWLVGETYPLYQSLPWSKTVTCTDICEFHTVPAGPATLTLSSATQDAEASRVQLIIAPDTRGTLDLRPDIEIADVTDTTPFLGQALPESDKQLLTGTIFTTNQYQSLITLRGSEGEFLYDILSRQSIRLPAEIDADSVARTATDGEYLIFSHGKTYRFDRFGRIPTTSIDSYSAGKISLTWSWGSTLLTIDDKTRTLAGWWWVLTKEEKTYLSDGKRIVEIKK